MALTASLGDRNPTVDPGGSTAFDVTLNNSGMSAETVGIRVAGAARPYAYVVPTSVALGAGGEAVVRVGFRLPRASTPPAGPLDFRLETTGGGDPSTTLAEGVLTVAPFSALSVALDPSEATAAGPSRHRLSVGNRGNSPVAVTLRVSHDDGVDVVVDPADVVAAPGESGTATVVVTPQGRPFTGAARDFEFTITATPEVGDPIEAPGRRRVPPAFPVRRLVMSAAVVGVVVVGLVAWALASSGGPAKQPAAFDNQPGGLAACPAAGHVDVRGVNGLRPGDIPSLPGSYSFLFVKDDSCSPVRFNPCEPIHYVQNAAQAPPTGAADVREAFARLSTATGMTFVDDGLTDETPSGRRNPYQPERYPQRWAPILVSWTRFPNQGPNPEIQSVGFGIGSRVSDVLVSGVLSLNVDAVTNKDTRRPLDGGFGPAIGSGTGAIGPEGVTWGRIILHELAHVVGLGHTKDKGAIMYPESADQTSRPSAYRPQDLEGLRYLGREAGCLTTPPTPGT